MILSAGSIGSPHLLLLSGIGQRDHLENFKIPVIHHLPGVGYNLQGCIYQVYLNNYFNLHVCPSFHASVPLSVVGLTPIPAGKSQDVTNKSCSICLRGDPWGPWRS